MQKLSSTVDQLGNPIEIWHSSSIQHTPCVSLFLRIYAELIDKEWTMPVVPFKPTNRVVWIQNLTGKVLAGIVYEYQSDFQNGYLVLSFTDPDHRGQGFNKICHDCYETDCKKLGAKILTSFVAVDNLSRIRSAEKVGMLPKFYKMQKNI
jgi:RimJ/RimL family protein N-acetyltransferase